MTQTFVLGVRSRNMGLLGRTAFGVKNTVQISTRRKISQSSARNGNYPGKSGDYERLQQGVTGGVTIYLVLKSFVNVLWIRLNFIDRDFFITCILILILFFYLTKLNLL